MSYARTTHTNGEPCIVFYYGSEDLFNKINLLTLYKAKALYKQAGDNAGENMIDEYALTEDERDAFYLFAKKAVLDVFAQVVKMTKSLANTVFLNSDAFDDELSQSITGENSYGFLVYDNDAYNDNVLQLIDNEVFEFIKNEILMDWWGLKGVSQVAAEYKAEWEKSRRLLVNNYLFQLRKPLIG